MNSLRMYRMYRKVLILIITRPVDGLGCILILMLMVTEYWILVISWQHYNINWRMFIFQLNVWFRASNGSEYNLRGHGFKTTFNWTQVVFSNHKWFLPREGEYSWWSVCKILLFPRFRSLTNKNNKIGGLKRLNSMRPFNHKKTLIQFSISCINNISW